MRVSVTVEQPSLTVNLSREMSVTIRDDGTITVRQAGRDLNPAARPDEPRYDMGGEYELTLPDASVIAAACDAREADPASDDFPASGTASIAVTHLH